MKGAMRKILAAALFVALAAAVGLWIAHVLTPFALGPYMRDEMGLGDMVATELRVVQEHYSPWTSGGQAYGQAAPDGGVNLAALVEGLQVRHTFLERSQPLLPLYYVELVLEDTRYRVPLYFYEVNRALIIVLPGYKNQKAEGLLVLGYTGTGDFLTACEAMGWQRGYEYSQQ